MSEYEVASLGLRQAALTATYWQTSISAGLSLLTLAVSSSTDSGSCAVARSSARGKPISGIPKP